jgi:hypothetical protein
MIPSELISLPLHLHVGRTSDDACYMLGRRSII